MKELKDIEKIATSENAKKGYSFREEINKDLMLRQSRYACRFGALGDGFDKITDSQRYFQAVKEMYHISMSMNDFLAQAMEVQANLLEAQQTPKKQDEIDEVFQLRRRAKIFRCETQLENIYIELQDLSRMLDEYNKVREELMPEVKRKYPEGIEQAEEDNWKAVGEYWALKRQMGALPTPITHLPLPFDKKAVLGGEMGIPELQVAFLVKNRDELVKKYKGNIPQFLADKLGLPLPPPGKPKGNLS